MSEDLKEKDFVTYETGAKRSEKKPRFDLIPSIALRRLADRYELGLKYGEHNWKKGLPFSDTFNHVVDHLERYKDLYKLWRLALENHDGQASAFYLAEIEKDDDLAGAMWGIATLMWFFENGVHIESDNLIRTVQVDDPDGRSVAQPVQRERSSLAGAPNIDYGTPRELR